MARTTIRLDDALLEAAKKEAVASGRTLGGVLEDAIRQLLAAREERRRSGPVTLPTFNGDGLLPGVDLDDSASLADLMGRDFVMILTDVNILVYAHREDSHDHGRYLEWLEGTVSSDAPFGVSDLVLSGFLRVVTHPRVFATPTPMEQALEFVEQLRTQPNAVLIAPGTRHWGIFVDICRRTAVRGNLVPDAYLAALAIESGSEWVTADRDYSRFPGLEWRHPLDT